MTSNNRMNVAVIGLGAMGMGTARALLRAGFSVTGTDVNHDAMKAFSAAGGKIAPSPAQAAAEADAVLTVVVNSNQTEMVLFGEAGAASAMNRGGVILSMATMAPEAACHLAARTEEFGLHYLDAPISGGAAKALSGELTVLASGKKPAFDLARPVLEALSAKLYEVGEAPGIGASFKMVNQLLAGVHIATACEAIVFARRLGLDIEKVY